MFFWTLTRRDKESRRKTQMRNSKSVSREHHRDARQIVTQVGRHNILECLFVYVCLAPN